MKKQFELNLGGSRKEAGLGGGIGGIIRGFKESKEARNRAKQDARAEGIRVQFAKRRNGYREAVSAVDQLVEKSAGQVIAADDEHVQGAGQLIARLSRRNPDVALDLAALLAQSSQLHNEVALAAHEEFLAIAQESAQTKADLAKHPLRIGGDLSSMFAGLLIGKPRSMGDRITVHPDKALIRNPEAPLGKVRIKPEQLMAGEVYAGPNWPKAIDRIFAWISPFLSDNKLEKIEKLVPVGTVVVGRSGRETPDVEISTWWPARKAKKLQDTFDLLMTPNISGVPRFKRETEPGTLLRNFSNSFRSLAEKVGRKNSPAEGQEIPTIPQDGGERFRRILNDSKNS